ncbi:MAG: VCBS repeat-containing protein [Deltaproteobacteria bacterium]|nr:VCBS repeat-containing protein [Deltaproteobacteria bacterium]
MLPLGCGADELGVSSASPRTGSARGGETVLVSGKGFADGAAVLFGGTAAPAVRRRSAEELEVTTPQHLAGPVDLAVGNPDGESASVPGLFAFAPLVLHFVEAASHFLPDLTELDATDAAAADFDGDGHADILVSARGERARLLRNTGHGGFLDGGPASGDAGAPPASATWVHDTRALLVEDFDADGDPDVFLCNGAGDSLVYLNDGAGAFEAALGAVPDGAGCRAAALADLDGDGRRDLLLGGSGPLAAGKSYVRVLRRAPGEGEVAFTPVAELEKPADAEGLPVGEVESSPGVSGTYTITQKKAASGSGAGQAAFDFSGGGGTVGFVHPAPPFGVLPDAIELEVLGDFQGATLKIRFTDGKGEQFVAEAGLAGSGSWQHLRVEDLPSWTPSAGGDGVVDLPIQSVALLVGAVAGGTKGLLLVDDVRFDAPELGPVPIEDFERVDFALAWPEQLSCVAAADLDGDGRPDAVLASADPGAAVVLRLLLNHTGAGSGAARLGEAGSDALAAVLERISYVAAIDHDGDRDFDLFAVGADGQDRLLVNDGAAHFFDDTLASLPVDRAAGRHADERDLDMDGRADLLIANGGAVSRIYLGRGASGFIDATPAMPLHASATLRLLPLDADGDGDQDLFVLNQKGERSRLYLSVEPPGKESE